MDELRTLNLGKEGLKETFIAEAKQILVKHKRLRVKVLKSALEGKNTKELALELSAKTNAIIDDVRGHTFILSRK